VTQPLAILTYPIADYLTRVGGGKEFTPPVVRRVLLEAAPGPA